MTEPSNEQLANFFTVYVKQIPQFQDLDPDPIILEKLFGMDLGFRETVLGYHREFQKKINTLHKQMEKGELQCEYIRPNGKRCPNHNQSGSYYCGLHQDID